MAENDKGESLINLNSLLGDKFEILNRGDAVTDNDGSKSGFHLIRESKKIVANRKDDFSRDEFDTLMRTFRVLIKDEKTGLYKSDALKYILDKRELRARRNLSLLLIDLDKFKNVNDSYGHNAGDAVLKRAGDIIKQSTRITDVAVRYGGDEFAVLLFTDKAGAERVAYRINESIYGDEVMKKYRVTASIGVAQTEKQDNLESIVGRADTAMYEGKKAGRNKVVSAETVEYSS